MGDAPPLFEFDEVTVAPNGRQPILDLACLGVPDRGITVVAGPSGAGKSTMLRLCNRLEVPTSGRVRHRGVDLATLDPLVLRRRVGMVFQRPTLFPGTVRQNLDVARPGGDDETFVVALERAGLDGSFLERTGDDLSGGEAQRACLARTLLTDPGVLLMDEPTSSLDEAMTRKLEQSVRMLADESVPVLWVTHDLGQARRIADRSVVLVGGQVADDAMSVRFLRGEDRIDD